LQKFASALLAVPVLVVVYLVAILRRSLIARGVVAVGLGALIGLAILTVVRPTSTVASRPTEIVPLTQAAFQTMISTDVEVDAPMTIEFSTAMARESVASSISVDPPTPVRLTWDATSTALTIEPATYWRPGAYHTITVQPGVLAESGRPLTVPARAVFLTRGPSAVMLAAADVRGSRVATDTAFTVSIDGDIDEASLTTAATLDPPVELRLTAKTGADGVEQFTFTPVEALDGDTTYRFVIDGARDTDGLAIGMSALEVRTLVAPAVVRFRPKAAATGVDRDDDISVRFTRAMDRATTKAAVRVTVGGKRIDGKITFAQGDKVLVFDPAKRLPYSAKVTMTVDTTALSAQGTAAAGGAFVAADARTGALLWQFNTGLGWKAAPMTYAIDGTQYVAVAAGSTIMAFGLP
jgi:hypothetical protein